MQVDLATWQFILTLLNLVEADLQTPRLTEQAAQLLDAAGISQADLLASLANVKQELYEETYGRPTPSVP